MSGIPTPGYMPDPNRPGFYDSRGRLGVSVCVAFSTLSLFVLSLRLYTRIRIVHHFGIEDLIIILSWLFASTFTALVVVQVTRGLGKHTWALTFDQYTSFAAPFWASICFYQLTIIVTKISILLQYFSIFQTGKERRACWAITCIVICYGIWSVTSAIFMCLPVAYFWDKAIPGGHCLPEQPVWFGNGALNIATDLMILILPMPTFSKLQLAKKQKIGLMMVLGLGGVVCVISMVRFQSLYRISISKDISWDNVPIAYWTAIESNVGIVCACLPSLKRLLLRFLPILMNSSPSILLADSEGAWEQRRFIKSATGHNHLVSTEASGPGPCSRADRVGLAVPLKVFVRHPRILSGDITPSDTENGGIKVMTVIEQDVADDKSNKDAWLLDV